MAPEKGLDRVFTVGFPEAGVSKHFDKRELCELIKDSSSRYRTAVVCASKKTPAADSIHNSTTALFSLQPQQIPMQRAAGIVRVLHDEEVTARRWQGERQTRVAVAGRIIGGGEQGVARIPQRERGIEW